MELEDEVKAFFARPEIQENLVTLTEVSHRMEVDISTVCTWRQRYPDFPEMLSPGRKGNSSYLAVYWWPEVQEFTRKHGLPVSRPVRNRQVNYGGNLKRLAASRQLLESQVKED